MVQGIRQRIEEFDFEAATPYELAVLLEQVYLYSDGRVRDGGPIITATGVLKRYEAAVRLRTAPELHQRMANRCREMRETLMQFDSLLRNLEKDSGKASS